MQVQLPVLTGTYFGVPYSLTCITKRNSLNKGIKAYNAKSKTADLAKPILNGSTISLFKNEQLDPDLDPRIRTVPD
jgi:hypothetical protein